MKYTDFWDGLCSCLDSATWTAIKASISLGGASFVIPYEAIAKICVVAARVSGGTATASVVGAVLITHFVIDSKFKEEKDYWRDVGIVALKMTQVIQKRQISIHGSAMSAHMMITAQQQRAIEDQQRAIEDQRRINANQQRLITGQRQINENQGEKIEKLQKQMSILMKRLE